MSSGGGGGRAGEGAGGGRAGGGGQGRYAPTFPVTAGDVLGLPFCCLTPWLRRIQRKIPQAWRLLPAILGWAQKTPRGHDL